MVARYKLFKADGTFISVTTLSEAAQLLNLAPEEIEWAIEEVGRCDTETYTLISNRRPKWPGPYNPKVEGPF